MLEKRTGIKVELGDGRRRSLQAKHILEEGNVHDRREQKQVIDKLAAVLILQSYLDSVR